MSLGVRSPPLLKPRTRREKRSPPSLKFSPRKKTQTPSVLLLQPKSPLPYVTGSYVTSLSIVLQSSGQDQIFHHPTVKFRHPPVFSLQRDSAVFTGDHASRRNEDYTFRKLPEQGK
ncbi:hypothetical protein AVEN_90530-1 [Araneus ventricosus]|uniref:Uncharacterized protein n=1 Tax=Araneus ventricosus TaxID=182803 RepID=A0A4Y2VUJ1_ARAVE|nr:hypothetical protein AVEN_90530-1 [Araneus ventricosus]